MQIGSLFSGIGGFDLAARWIGWETKWYSEIDPYAIRVMERHFPNAYNVGDIKKWAPTRQDRVDVVCGGFPCQDISSAGKMEGIYGERSGLWWQFARTLDVLRPRYVVIENVRDLVVNGLNEVLSELARLGYNAVWQTISAESVGAPHRRERVWIVAYPSAHDVTVNVEISGIQDGVSFDVHPTHVRKTQVWCENWESFKLVFGRVAPEKWTPTGQISDTRSLLVRSDNGIPDGVDRIGCIGNAIVPQIAHWIFSQIQEYENGLHVR